MSDEWINADGSTNVDGFLHAYAEDDNTFWRADTGHIQNVLDDVTDRLARSEAEIDRLRAALSAIAFATQGNGDYDVIHHRACSALAATTPGRVGGEE